MMPPAIAKILVCLICLTALPGCEDRSLPQSDIEYARYFEDNRSFFNGVLELSKQSSDLPSEMWPRDATNVPKALQDLLVGKSNLARIDFGTRYVKIYVASTGIVGTPATFKGFIGYKDSADCPAPDVETDQIASAIMQQGEKNEMTAFKKLNDTWCIFYTIEMD